MPHALIFIVDFTELSSRTSGLPGFTFRNRAQSLFSIGFENQPSAFRHLLRAA